MATNTHESNNLLIVASKKSSPNYDELLAKCEVLEEENRSLKKQLNVMTDYLDDKNQTIENLREKISMLEKENGLLKDKLKQHEDRINELEYKQKKIIAMSFLRDMITIFYQCFLLKNKDNEDLKDYVEIKNKKKNKFHSTPIFKFNLNDFYHDLGDECDDFKKEIEKHLTGYGLTSEQCQNIFGMKTICDQRNNTEETHSSLKFNFSKLNDNTEIATFLSKVQNKVNSTEADCYGAELKTIFSAFNLILEKEKRQQTPDITDQSSFPSLN